MQTEGAIGIIGGSGLCQMDGLEVVDEVAVPTPFGPPSDSYILGNLGSRPVVFLARHGRGHRLLPGELNFRANIWGFKKLGVDRIVAVSAVGSMKEDIRPRHVVLPDQFIDRTHGRAGTFFGEGIVAHVAFAEPVCPELHAALHRAAIACEATVRPEGTYVCIEGPAFSTRAESRLYRSWGASVVGMTNLPEAKLAREAEMCYATLALVTDFDCWHETEEDVSAEAILESLRENVAAARRILAQVMPSLGSARTCACGQALAKALVTPAELMPAKAREKLDIIIGKHLE